MKKTLLTYVACSVCLTCTVLAINKTHWYYPTSNITVHYGDTIICSWGSTYTEDFSNISLRLDLFCSAESNGDVYGSMLLPWGKEVSPTADEPVAFSNMNFVGWDFPFNCSFTLSPNDDWVDQKRGNSSTPFILQDGDPERKDKKTWSANPTPSTSSISPTSTTASTFSGLPSSTENPHPAIPSPAPSPAETKNGSHHFGLIAGVAILGLVMIVALVAWVQRRKRRKRIADGQAQANLPNHGKQRSSRVAFSDKVLFRRRKKTRDHRVDDGANLKEQESSSAQITEADYGTTYASGDSVALHELPGGRDCPEIDGQWISSELEGPSTSHLNLIDGTNR